MLERRDPEVWDILEEVIYQHPVMLNRAPTLHRMGIQAFEPVLVEGNAIKIHPLVCKGFNADFDGDQMAVHLPLSIEAQAETHVLMLAPNNIFSPANGTPDHHAVAGHRAGHLLHHRATATATRANTRCSTAPREALLAYELGKISMHTRIFVRLQRSHAGRPRRKVRPAVRSPTRPGRPSRRIASARIPTISRQAKPENFDGHVVLTTVGRCIFNDILPDAMPFYNYALTSAGGSRVIADTYATLGRPATIKLLDDMKSLGFKRSTLAGLSFGITDIRTPESKADHPGRRPEEGRQDREDTTAWARSPNRSAIPSLIDLWGHARKQVTEDLMTGLENDYRDEDGKPVSRDVAKQKGLLKYLNPINMMATSKARGSVDQMRQLGGMRGLMAKPSGEIIETPIKANFREGLCVLEYFSSTHGARKGLADTALKTADSRLSHPQARRRGPERHRQRIGLQDAQRRDQDHHLQRRNRRSRIEGHDRRPHGPRYDPQSDHRRDDRLGKPDHHQRDRRQAQGTEAGKHPRALAADVRKPARRLRRLLWRGHVHQPGCRGRSGRRHHRRPVHRRTRHAAHHAHVPHRRRGHRAA